ncbi:MAG: glycosyl transferase [Cyanobacteria bacterium P01_A01_bin.105]
MAPPTLYLAITNHGFGHATRAASVAATLLQQMPDLRLIIATTAPQWLLASYLGDTQVEYREKQFDIGVLQRDSLNMDLPAALEKLRWIRAHEDEILADEVAFLQAEKVDLVLADIPPLATVLAQKAGVPCYMMSNFGWDFIYRAWGGAFIEIADWIAECFSQCDRIFRLPFHEPMSAFPHITDVGLTGGTPKLSEDEVRHRYDLTAPSAKTVLVTFGGLGLSQIPYDTLKHFPDWQFLTFDRSAPDLPNVRVVRDLNLRPVDIMPVCDLILSKPGYSTFSEACRLEKAMITLPRADFAEAQLLLDGIQAHAYHRVVEPEAFFTGNWDFLRQPLIAPKLSPKLTNGLRKDGNETIAGAISTTLKPQ